MLLAGMRSLVVVMAIATGCNHTSSPAPHQGDSRSPASDVQTPLSGSGSAYRIRYDQLGYRPDTERYAVVVSSGKPAAHYRLVDASTKGDVGAGVAGPRTLLATSRAGTPLTGDRIDFASLSPGTYYVALDDGSRAGPIRVATDAYARVLPLVAQFLAEQRCGPTTKSASGHGPCHLFRSLRDAHSGDGVAVDDGALPPYRAGNPVDVEGGWHDAGDYLKFALTASYVLATELMALSDHRGSLGAAGEAIARELRWGLDWLLKMETGDEPFHQVGGEGDHEVAWRLPQDDTLRPIPAYDGRPAFRMASGRGRNVLGRSAAAFAFASEVYATDAAYAQKLLVAAESTYALAKRRAGIQNSDPPDFYREDSGEDDLLLAAGALARASRNPTYIEDARSLRRRLMARAGTPVGYASVDALALLAAGRAFPAGSAERTDFVRKADWLAAPIANTAAKPIGPGAAFGYAMPAFGNGSIAEALGAAATCMAARRLAGTPGCDVVARRHLHWLFGLNPFGISFLVGAGTSWPHNLHHSFAQAAHVALLGAIAGGPTALPMLAKSGLQPPPVGDSYARWSTDDLLYEDNADDYVCNEPAIDFGAALVFVLAELDDPSPPPTRQPLRGDGH